MAALPICGQTTVTPAMLAAAWRAFRGDRKGPLLGPGPAFREAIGAALAVRANDEEMARGIRRVIAPLNGCEDADEDYRACVLSSCQCMQAAREVLALVAIGEARG